MDHQIQWYSPAPFWQTHLENGSRDHLRSPALLQFEQDDFMNDLQDTLSGTPGDLSTKQAEEEKHLGRNGTTASGEEPIPLYQPAHQRYYLVTASLVCRERGLPDRAVDTTNEERAAFVLRRLVTQGEDDTNGRREYGWTGSAWKPVKDPETVADAEQPVKMFPKSYAPDAQVAQMKGKRRLWAGLIPVAKRDTFETAPIRRTGTSGASENGDSTSGSTPAATPDQRRTVFEARVVQGFKNLRDALSREGASPGRATARDLLLFAWLDFWEFLQAHLPDVAAKINPEEAAKIKSKGSAVAADFPSRGEEKVDLIETLRSLPTGPKIGALGKNAAAILRSVAHKSEQITAGKLDAVLPTKKLPVLGPNGNGTGNTLADFLDELLDPNTKEQSLEDEKPQLQKKVSAALSPPENGDEDLQPPATDPVQGGTYVVRCLYVRPKCPEPLKTTVSKPSDRFRLASFFDAEAPARDINITMPGVSVKDFRNSSQSATMVFTTELGNQVKKIQDTVFEELGADKDIRKIDLGRICSLSIPIITICALVLLLVIVVVLNIVFWWLPFFKICFPLPTGDSQ